MEELKEKKKLVTELAEQEGKATSKLKKKKEALEKALSEMAAAMDDMYDTVYFDELGITRLFVDEAHNFKNVPFETKANKVLGISGSGSKRCQDMMDKVHMVQKKNDGKGVVLATGTPITNSITDAYIMQQYVVLQHCLRQGDRDSEQFNIACDIVVNSNILLSENMNLKAITLKKYGESMHLAPDGKEGYEYTAEQVYEMLPPSPANGKPKPALTGTLGEDGSDDEKDGDAKGSALGRAKQTQGKSKSTKAIWDDHTRWGMEEEDDTLRDVWRKRIEDIKAPLVERLLSGTWRTMTRRTTMRTVAETRSKSFARL